MVGEPFVGDWAYLFFQIAHTIEEANMMKLEFGRRLYGLSAVGLSVITLLWHQVDALGSISHPAILVYAVVVIEVAGGVLIQWERTKRVGTLILIAIFSIFSLYWIPAIIKTPFEFSWWGNFGEQFSLVLGGVFVLVSTIQGREVALAKILRPTYVSYALCVVSYALYQIFYITYTASLVPKWIPPGQMFWAVATTIAFALAAIALLSGRSALLASRLLTLMIILLGLLVWIPPAFANPHTLSNWRELAENYLMAGASWIFSDFLSQPNTLPSGWPFVRQPVEEEEE